MDSNCFLIKQFLDNEMSPEELKAFQTRLKTDEVLAEELAITKDLKKMLTSDQKHQHQTQALEKTLHDLGNQYFDDQVAPTTTTPTTATTPSQPAKTSKLIPILAIAASIALLIFAGSYFMNSNNVEPLEINQIVSLESIATDNFVKLSTTVRGKGDGDYKYLDENSPQYLCDHLKEANKAFKAKDYDGALKHFSAILSSKDISKYDVRRIDMEGVRWNVLICEVALGPKSTALQKIEAFLDGTISEGFREDALEMRAAVLKI